MLKAWLGRDSEPGTPIKRLELGEISAEEFDPLLAAELRTLIGEPVETGGLVSRLFAETRPDEAMWRLVTDLRACGIRVGILSNSWGGDYLYDRFAAAFDTVVISGEVGLRKPDAAIYELALRQLGLQAGAVAFVDDAKPNVLGAAKVGMHGIHHLDAAQTRTEFCALVRGLDE
ncbi:HAD family hydrolase [Streptomyces sp. NPDC056352]|uniref:HAD family hydrolase n=1 Tax=Streptomyces sp. NPDC056352 TaxID=3345791 RepID=UPI0035DE61C7